MPQKSFEEQLRDKSSEFTLQPKAGLWETVSAQLEPEKEKRRAYFFLPVALGMVIVVAAVVFAVYRPSDIEKQVIAVSGKHEVSNASTDQEEKLKKHSGVITGEQDNIASQDKGSVEADPGKTNRQGRLSNAGKKEYINSPRAGDLAAVSAGDEKSERSLKMPDQKESQEHTRETSHQTKQEQPDIMAGKYVPQKIDADQTGNTGKTPDPTMNHKDSTDSFKTLVETMAPKVKTNDSSKVFKAVLSAPGLAKKTYVEFLAGPVLSGTWVHAAPTFRDSSTFRSQAEDRKNTDRKNWNFSAGLQVGMDHKKFSFSAGLHYQVLSYQVYVMNINSRILNTGITTTSFDFNATDSFAMVRQQSPAKGVSTYITNKFQYLSIPLSVGYKFRTSGRFSAGMGTTVSPQFLLAYKGLFYQQSSGYYVKEKSAVENNIQKMNLSLRADITLSYRTGPFSALVFNPYYGVSLFAAERSAINTGHVFLGFSAGFRKYL